MITPHDIWRDLAGALANDQQRGDVLAKIDAHEEQEREPGNHTPQNPQDGTPEPLGPASDPAIPLDRAKAPPEERPF